MNWVENNLSQFLPYYCLPACQSISKKIKSTALATLYRAYLFSDRTIYKEKQRFQYFSQNMDFLILSKSINSHILQIKSIRIGTTMERFQ